MHTTMATFLSLATSDSTCSRGGHSHMRHINGCDWGQWCGHGVSEDFWVWSRGHQRLLVVVTGSPKDFWCGHRVTNIYCQSHGVMEQCCAARAELRTYIQVVPQVPSSSVVSRGGCGHAKLVHQLRMLCRSLV